MLEALQKGLITRGQPARKLREQPEIVKTLQAYNQSVQPMPRLNIRVEAITSTEVQASQSIRIQEELMTNDAATINRQDFKSGDCQYRRWLSTVQTYECLLFSELVNAYNGNTIHLDFVDFIRIGKPPFFVVFPLPAII